MGGTLSIFSYGPPGQAPPPAPALNGALALYPLVAAAPLPAFGPRGAWDRLTWDASAGGRLFVSFGEDGVAVVPAPGGVPVPGAAYLLPNSNDCNGMVLAPAGLGFCGDVAEFTGNAPQTDQGEGVYMFNLSASPPTFLGAIGMGGCGVDNGVYDMYSGAVRFGSVQPLCCLCSPTARPPLRLRLRRSSSLSSTARWWPSTRPRAHRRAACPCMPSLLTAAAPKKTRATRLNFPSWMAPAVCM